MNATARRVYLRYAKGKLDLADWGLEGLEQGRSVTLYHGTTKSFRTFDMAKSRTELVNNYYGAGIFLTPKKSVAEQYADANRNIGFDPSIIDDLKRRNKRAGEFMQVLYDQGKEGWDVMIEKVKAEYPDLDLMTAMEKYLGISDPNTVDDVCGYIIGSKIKPLERDSNNIFDTSTGAPGWIYDNLDTLGLDSNEYRPKVYTVEVAVKKPLVTASKSQARGARSKGYDSVVYYGPDLVGGVPEVAVFSPSNVRIKHVEVI